MKLNHSQKLALSKHFPRIMRESGISKKVLSYLISRFDYDESRRDWASEFEGWKFCPCLDRNELLWFTLYDPQGKQFNYSLVGKPHYGDEYIILES